MIKKLYLGITFFLINSVILLFAAYADLPIHITILFGGFAILSLTLLIYRLLSLYRKLKLSQQKQLAIASNLHDYQARFNIIFESANLGLALVNIDNSILKVNPAFCELFNYSENELHSINLSQLIHAGDITHIQLFMKNLIEHKQSACQSELQVCQKGGENIWVMLTLNLLLDRQGKPAAFIVQMQNISAQKRAEENLRHMAYHDPLTGLANRNKLEQFINHLLASSRRQPHTFGLLFLDLDRFKTINDTIGHEAGDILLQVVAERLKSAVRITDLVARLGGDEFVLVITDVKKTESVAIIAQKILDTVLQPIVIKGQELYISTSIGISLYPYDGQAMQSLMKNADLALYRAKEHGRNNYQFYTIEMTGKAQERLALQNALGHALNKEEFTLNYQPIMSNDLHTINSVEALLRWQNEEYSTVTIDEIISLAEESGLIVSISEWTLKTACKQLKAWHEAGFTNLKVAINCSGRQFKQTSFTDELQHIIKEICVPASAIEIEVTEKLIMEDPENTLRVLYALKDIGVKIVIDDFGTGYWSLNNLRRLSVDKIKIDKSFIKQIPHDETSTIIVSAIIAMANKLGMTTVAEGVETQEQYDFLLQEGCSEIQGYYLSQPLSVTDMTKFLSQPLPEVFI